MVEVGYVLVHFVCGSVHSELAMCPFEGLREPMVSCVRVMNRFVSAIQLNTR